MVSKMIDAAGLDHFTDTILYIHNNMKYNCAGLFQGI